MSISAPSARNSEDHQLGGHLTDDRARNNRAGDTWSWPRDEVSTDQAGHQTAWEPC